MDFDMRPVYRWSWHFGTWLYMCDGRMTTPCRWQFREDRKETTWKVRCPNCGAKTEFSDLSWGNLVSSDQSPPWWVGTGCAMWIGSDMQCGHPLGLADVIRMRVDKSKSR